MKNISTFAGMVLCLILPCIAIAGPERFPSATSAESAGCRSASLKGPNIAECFLAEPDDRTVNFTIYDKDNQGGFLKSTVISIPSWYESARATSAKVAPDGSEWLVVDTEGMRGTGIQQRVFIMIAWDGTKFRPVSIESGNYTCTPPTMYPRYALKVHRVLHSTPKGPSLSLDYVLLKDGRPVSKWTDKLNWDKDAFLMVEVGSTIKSRESVSDAIRARISNVRKYLTAHRPELKANKIYEWSGESNINEILLPEGYP